MINTPTNKEKATQNTPINKIDNTSDNYSKTINRILRSNKLIEKISQSDCEYKFTESKSFKKFFDKINKRYN
jgi:hypothetical protein